MDGVPDVPAVSDPATSPLEAEDVVVVVATFTEAEEVDVVGATFTTDVVDESLEPEDAIVVVATVPVLIAERDVVVTSVVAPAVVAASPVGGGACISARIILVLFEFSLLKRASSSSRASLR